jgi:hypothetical protein
MAMKILETNGNDFDALKGAALALAHIALEEESRVRSQLMLTKAGLAQLKKDNFLSLVHGGEDTWCVQLSMCTGLIIISCSIQDCSVF